MAKIHRNRYSRDELFEYFMQLKRWGFKGGLAILDQGVYSGSNFAFNILLARWLSANNYGAFSLVFAFFLFFTGFYNAMILEPISVFGTSKYAGNIHGYLSSQFVIHFVITGMLGIFISFIGFVLSYFDKVDPFLSQAIIGMGLFLPLILLMWLARRAFYVLSRPGWALLISSGYSVGLLGGAFYLHSIKIDNPISWFGVMGISSFAGLMILSKLDVINPVTNREIATGWRKLLVEQWIFSKWIVVAAFFYFAATQIQIFIAAGVLGLDVAGAYSALQNFMLPMMQILTAISALSLPAIAFAFGRQNYVDMRRKSFLVAGVLFAMSIVYLAFLFLFANSLEAVLYAGRYKAHIGLIPFLAVVPLLTSIEIGFSLVVRSLQRSVYHAILTLSMAVAGVVSGLLLIPAFGLAGAIASLIVSAAFSLIVNIWFYRAWFSKVFLLPPA